MVPEPVGRLLHEQEEPVVQDQVHSLDALVLSGASVGVLEVKVPAAGEMTGVRLKTN